MRAALLAVALLASTPAAAQALAEPRSAAIEAELREAPHPAAIHVVGDGDDYGAANGWADVDEKRPLTTDTPLRIASNTKTFVAATVLRLWEQGRIDLDASIGPLLTPRHDAALRRDGYDTRAITVRHLLSHSAGLYDHGGDKRFVDSLMTNPGKRWTRSTLVDLSMEYADPQSPPGTEFRYSDTGYILLGDIVERITRRNLARAVREQLRLDRLGLTATWWEVFEAPPRSARPRARQYLGETEVTGVDPSMDLFGGGGQLASARDLATFFKALFGGRVFVKPETLREMLWQGPHKGADTYRLGIFVKHTPAGDIYWHSGFWGTWAGYAPATGRAAGAVSTQQRGVRPLMPAVEAALTGGS